jgi:oxygen-independent coproporphyrinogen-3 oxidase
LQGPFLEAVRRELAATDPPHEIETLFFGGGTPTRLSASNLRRLVRDVRQRFTLADDYEFTVEANPEDLSPQIIRVLCDLGVNRISLGVQSFDNGKLARLERGHRREDLWRVLPLCRRFFASVAVDLIFAAPGETPADWQSDLADVLAAEVDHISTYGLSYEKGAPFWSARMRGLLQPLDEDSERAMLETAIDTLTGAGFEHYEVSNFARPAHRCRHNVAYWKGREYYGFGPGAARYRDGWREINHRSTTTYLKRVLAGKSPVAERERLPPEARARERLVFQLRMLEGVRRDEFSADTGFAVEQLLGASEPRLIQWGLLQHSGQTLQLTREGLFVSDAVFGEILTATASRVFPDRRASDIMNPCVSDVSGSPDRTAVDRGSQRL